ncbi:MAG TPA: ABC transporter substrate-binding protein, partial [Aggregatilineales bacterium]|nr:ABC transporter substrate-binding protein [Aggregatilineales bacterium]
MSKNLLRLLALMVTALVLAVSAFPRIPAAAANVVNLRIFVGLGTGTDDTQRQGQDALAKEWNAKHPDIQIKFEYNDYATARDVLLTQVAGGQAPDIVGPVGIGGLNETGDLWADLGAYIKKDTAALNLSDFEKATLGL